MKAGKRLKRFKTLAKVLAALVALTLAMLAFLVWAGQSYLLCGKHGDEAMEIAEQYLRQHMPEYLKHVKGWEIDYPVIYIKNIERLMPDATKENTFHLRNITLPEDKVRISFDLGCDTKRVNGIGLTVLNRDGSIRNTPVASAKEAMGLINTFAATLNMEDIYVFQGMYKSERDIPPNNSRKHVVDWNAFYSRRYGDYGYWIDGYWFELSDVYEDLEIWYRSYIEKTEATGTVRLSREQAYEKAEEYRKIYLKQDKPMMSPPFLFDEFRAPAEWINIPEETVIRAVPPERFLLNQYLWHGVGYTSWHSRLSWIFYYKVKMEDQLWQSIAVDAENGDLVRIFGDYSVYPRTSKNARVMLEEAE